jgi:glycosyltransferase involved in cell wall biosynthesis
MKLSSHTPLVSVIILSYNQEGIIGRAIVSVLDQTYKNIQLVIVDDCSKDNSRQVIADWQKKYPGQIKTYFQPVNVGHPANMNTGYKLCDGELITFCDGDDWYFPKSVETQVDFLRNNPDYDVVYTNFSFHDMEGNLLKVWASNTDKITSGDIFPDLFSLNYPGNVHPHFEMTFKKIIFDTGFYDESIPIWVDWDFRLRLAAKYKCGYCSYVGNAYTTHPGGLTSTLKKETYLHNMIKVINKNKKELDKYQPALKRKVLKSINMHVEKMRLSINLHKGSHTFFQTLQFLWRYPNQIKDIRFAINCMFGKKTLTTLSSIKRKLMTG